MRAARAFAHEHRRRGLAALMLGLAALAGQAATPYPGESAARSQDSPQPFDAPRLSSDLLMRTIERAGVAEPSVLDLACDSGSRASLTQARLRFQERSSTTADRAALTAAMAQAELDFFSLGLRQPDQRECKAKLEYSSLDDDYVSSARLGLSGDVSVIRAGSNRFDNEAVDEDVFATLTADYDFGGSKLGPFTYSSSVAWSTYYTREAELGFGSARQNAANATHGLSESWRLGRSILSLGVSQSVNQILASRTRAETALSHTIRGSWSSFGPRAQTSTGFSYTGTHANGLRTTGSRSALLFGRHRYQLTPSARLSTDLSLIQSDRRAELSLPDGALSLLVLDPTQTSATRFYSALLAYQQRATARGFDWDLSLGVRSYRTQTRIDSLGLFRYEAGNTVHAIEAGLSFSRTGTGFDLSTRARVTDSGALSLGVVFSSDLGRSRARGGAAPLQGR